MNPEAGDQKGGTTERQNYALLTLLINIRKYPDRMSFHSDFMLNNIFLQHNSKK